MFYQEEEENIVKKFEGFKNNSLKNNRVILTKFLNLREQELLEYIIGKNSGLYLYFSNISGFDEYKRAIISPFELECDFKIKLLKLNYSNKFNDLNHRHILGTIMGLQIERNMIGDILVSHEGNIYIISSEEMADFIKNNLISIDHLVVTLSEETKLEGNFSPRYDVKKHFVNSLRVDLIISEGFNISRNSSLEEIKAGNLKINQRKELNPVKNVSEGDIISLKGYGRMKVISVGGTSKSGKIIVELGKLK